MKSDRIVICFVLCFMMLFLPACSNEAAKASTVIEMELTDSYDDSDPFINEKLIYVSGDIDTLTFDVSFEMEGESGVLEIVNRETDQVLWDQTWNGNVDEPQFTIALENLEKEKEYVIRFAGTQINHAKIVMTSESKLVEERERPARTPSPSVEKDEPAGTTPDSAAEAVEPTGITREQALRITADMTMTDITALLGETVDVGFGRPVLLYMVDGDLPLQISFPDANTPCGSNGDELLEFAEAAAGESMAG